MSRTKTDADKKPCTRCGKKRAPTKNNWYYSNSPLYVNDGLFPVCKDCINQLVDSSNLDTVHWMLRMMDRVWRSDLWDAALKEVNDRGVTRWSSYMKLIAMPQYQGLTWNDSDHLKQNTVYENNKNTEKESQQKASVDTQKQEANVKTDMKNFIVTDELLDKYGFGFEPEEYYFFEKKYNRLIRNYGEKTEMHREKLITYIIYKVKAELATAKGDIREAKEWDALASNAAKSAKMNPEQMSKSDISGGVDVLSQLFEAVESEVGIIPQLPKLLEQPYDDADIILWSVINYHRRLEDKPPVKYKDIYNFYDEMIEEHFRQQGFTDEQIEIEKQKRNNVFRDLSKVYYEPLYDDESGDE